MKIFSTVLAAFIIFCFSISTSGQSTNAENANPLATGSIHDQFDYVINKSSKYEDYRVIKNGWISKLKSNALDSITSLESKIIAMQSKNSIQAQKMDSLSNQLKITNEQFSKAISEKNALSFLGIQMEKSAYQNITFTLIFLLILGIVGLFFMFKKSNIITNETKESLIELQEEFEAQRKRTLEREQTMARNHLNELNKLRNK